MPWIILAVSAITHLFRFDHPSSIVFDEVHNSRFLLDYWSGNYFFDVHPPLGRLIETFFGYITGANHLIFDYSKIGNSLPDPVILLRLAPILAGIALPLIVYAILKRLDFSKMASFTGAMLICLENSLIVQSRFILYDIFMLVFGFLAILCYLEYSKILGSSHKKTLLFIVSLLCAAAVPGIKWTGLAFPLLIVLMEFYKLIKEKVRGKILIKKILKFGTLYFGITLIVYMSLFAIHFALLPHSGTGDAFMSERFNASLTGNIAHNDREVKPKSFLPKFIELNWAMLQADSRLTNPHQYSSKWYTWPLELRSIFYWQGLEATSTLIIPEEETMKTRSYIYLLGNPVIYWLGTLSMIILIINGVLLSIIRKNKTDNISDVRKKALFFIIIGYIVNFLPFIFIGRVMFLYHYEAALIFSIIAMVFILDSIKSKNKSLVAIILLVITFTAFIYWSPLTYGTPLTDNQLKSRMWLPTWR